MATKEDKSKSVFISYGRELDVSQFVKQLKRDLEAKLVWKVSPQVATGTAQSARACRSVLPLSPFSRRSTLGHDSA